MCQSTNEPKNAPGGPYYDPFLLVYTTYYPQNPGWWPLVAPARGGHFFRKLASRLFAVHFFAECGGAPELAENVPGPSRPWPACGAPPKYFSRSQVGGAFFDRKYTFRFSAVSLFVFVRFCGGSLRAHMCARNSPTASGPLGRPLGL